MGGSAWLPEVERGGSGCHSSRCRGRAGSCCDGNGDVEIVGREGLATVAVDVKGERGR